MIWRVLRGGGVGVVKWRMLGGNTYDGECKHWRQWGCQVVRSGVGYKIEVVVKDGAIDGESGGGGGQYWVTAVGVHTKRRKWWMLLGGSDISGRIDVLQENDDGKCINVIKTKNYSHSFFSALKARLKLFWSYAKNIQLYFCRTYFVYKNIQCQKWKNVIDWLCKFFFTLSLYIN